MTAEKLAQHEIRIDYLEKTQGDLASNLQSNILEVKKMLSEQSKKTDENQAKMFDAIHLANTVSDIAKLVNKNEEKTEKKIDQLNEKISSSNTDTKINKVKFSMIYYGVGLFFTGAAAAVTILKFFTE